MGSLTCAPTRPPGKLRSISDPQQILPLPQPAFEAQALGHPKRRDHAPLDCLAALSGSLARESKFLAGPVEMSRKGVMLAGLELGEQEIDVLPNLAEFRNERLSVH